MKAELKFKSPTQEAVVNARIKDGYVAETLPNGDIELIKGRHYMIINAHGYDVWVDKIKNYGI